MDGNLLGLDIGTTGVKAVLIDASGTTSDTATHEYPLHTPHPNWAEQDPADWWKATASATKHVMEKAGVSPESILAVGLSGQMHSLVPLDMRRNVIRPAILWCDTRTEAECRQITEEVGRETLRSLVSNPALEGFTLPKILWMRNHEPELYRQIATVLLPKDYIRFRLTEEIAMDVSDASGTLMFDVANRRWSAELLRKVQVPEEWLPRVVESVEVCGMVSREAAGVTGLKPGTPVVGGGADNTCGAVGTGVVREGLVLASIGTSGVVFAHSDSMRVEKEMRAHTFCHSVPHTWYVMGVILMAGGAFRWYRDVFCAEESAKASASGADVYDLLTAEAEAVEPGAEGLFFLPHLIGERTPHQSASARGAFVGATIRHSKKHFTRAAIEGITFAMRDSLEIVRGLGIEIGEIRLTGGGAKSPFWRKLQADVYGCEVTTLNTTEGPAFGAALLAGVGAQVYPTVADAVGRTVKVAERIAPDRWEVERYDESYGLYRTLYPSLRGTFAHIHSTYH